MGKGISKILPGLYVGSFADSTDYEGLQSHKITHIISACDLGNDEVSRKCNIDRIVINIKDTSTESISPHFFRCIEFIHRARADGGAVLVHCVAGVSRSVTLTAAYLLAISDLNWRQAISCVRAGRVIANPNFGFQKQLQDWCESERWRSVEWIKRMSALPYNDKQTLEFLLEKHEKWVETGKHDEDNFYPLAPGAYKTNPVSTGPYKQSDDSKAELSKANQRWKKMGESLRSSLLTERRYEAKTAQLLAQGSLRSEMGKGASDAGSSATNSGAVHPSHDLLHSTTVAHMTSRNNHTTSRDNHTTSRDNHMTSRDNHMTSDRTHSTSAQRSYEVVGGGQQSYEVVGGGQRSYEVVGGDSQQSYEMVGGDSQQSYEMVGASQIGAAVTGADALSERKQSYEYVTSSETLSAP